MLEVLVLVMPFVVFPEVVLLSVTTLLWAGLLVLLVVEVLCRWGVLEGLPGVEVLLVGLVSSRGGGAIFAPLGAAMPRQSRPAVKVRSTVFIIGVQVPSIVSRTADPHGRATEDCDEPVSPDMGGHCRWSCMGVVV
ncbi:hypothetical protein CRD60_05730 [Bifidobacterium aemilianum]|uniref:Uncharacterized protein n=1 Tax=Bifidobacterium aemilianum TaxID=2493120 RepID=A0A366K7T2_9BIFI|nr:hypothetical protein CRD60_05730 [Bifidobacterium aemilianum]